MFGYEVLTRLLPISWAGNQLYPNISIPNIKPLLIRLLQTSLSIIISALFYLIASGVLIVTPGRAVNQPPKAEAGINQTVKSGAKFFLSGRGSDADSKQQILSYSWKQIKGKRASLLTSNNIASPKFKAPKLRPGGKNLVLIFLLKVKDEGGLFHTDMVQITVLAPAPPAPPVPAPPAPALIALIPVNSVPIAHAGSDKIITSGASYYLDGSASHTGDKGQVLMSHRWTQVISTSNPSPLTASDTGYVRLLNTNTLSPHFIAPVLAIGAAPLTLTFSLVVNDGIEDSAPAMVSITVKAPVNSVPIAHAGSDKIITSGASYYLDGAASHTGDKGQVLMSHRWTQVISTSNPSPLTASDTGYVRLLNTNTLSPHFIAPVLAIGAAPLTLTFSLVVNDGIEDSAPAMVSITVKAPVNSVPIAHAGSDKIITSGASYYLDGAASHTGDKGQVLMSHRWTQVISTSNPSPLTASDTGYVRLLNTNTLSPHFIAPVLAIGAAPLTLTFSLVVNDGIEDSVPAMVSITVKAPVNSVPIAHAGSDKIITSGASYYLDGSASHTGDKGQVLMSHRWTQVISTSNPSPLTASDTGYVRLLNTNTLSPHFIAPVLAIGAAPLTLTFSLVVNDGIEDSAPAMVSITVKAPVNSVPIAHAGSDKIITSGASYYLDGAASHTGDKGQVLMSHRWTQVISTSNPSPLTASDTGYVRLLNTNTLSPHFIAPVLAIGAAPLTLTFSLVVNDGIEDSAPAMVSITVKAPVLEVPARVTRFLMPEKVKKLASNFVAARASHVFTNQLSMIGFVTGSNNNGGGPLGDLRLNSDLNSQTTMSFYTSRSKVHAAIKDDRVDQGDGSSDTSGVLDRTGSFDVWTQIQGSQSSRDRSKAKLWTTSLGSHYFLEKDLLMGFVGQFDWFDRRDVDASTNLASKVNGAGFMVGPYISGKTNGQKLYYEARALWGQSDNRINPIGTDEDTFKTTRWLASVKLEGSYDLSAYHLGGFELNRMKLKPSVSLSYFEELQKSYIDSNGQDIPEQMVSLGEFRFGPKLTHLFDLGDIMGGGYRLTTNVGLSGIVTFAERNTGTTGTTSTAGAGNTLGTNKTRARIDAGIAVENGYGVRFTAAGFYDGVGAKNYSSYGGRLGILIPLN